MITFSNAWSVLKTHRFQAIVTILFFPGAKPDAAIPVGETISD
jgi:hypothetical protein